jgi:hypothetical protein
VSRRSRFAPAGAAALVGLALLLPARALPAQQPDSLTDILVSIRLLRGPERLVEALARDSVPLIPLRSLLDLAEVRVVSAEPGSRVEALMEPGRVPLRVDTRDGYWSRNGAGARLDSADAVWRRDELYLAARVAAQLLRAHVAVDWADLTVLFSDVEHLPVMARRARELRRRYQALAPRIVADSVLRPRPAPLDGGVVEWMFQGDLEDPGSSHVWGLTGGAALVGGNLEFGTVGQRSGGRSSTRDRWSWARAWPEAGSIRQVRLGDVLLESPTAVPIRGAVVTNVPHLRPAEFGDAVLSGRLPPGWEMEVVRGGRVVAAAPADSAGAWRLEAPVAYGINPTELRAYGPTGEIVVSQRALEVLPERLPAGRFEYALSGGSCQGGAICDGVLSADARYGLTSRVTARGGILALRDTSGGDAWHPYVQAAASVTPSLHLVGDAMVDGYSRARVLVSPHPDLRVDLAHSVFAASDVRTLVGAGLEDWRSEAVGYWRPGGGAWQLQGAATEAGGPGRRRGQLRLGGLVRVSNATVTLTVRRERLRSATTVNGRWGLDADARLLVARGGPLRQALVGATLVADCSADWFRCPPRPSGGRLTMGRSFAGGGTRIEAGVTWNRDQPARVDVTLSALTSYLRAVTRTLVVEGGEAAATQLLEGSFLFDRGRERVLLGDGRSVGRAALSGVVYYDENGNGRQDRGEAGVPELLLRVGSRAVATDTAGRFGAVDLLPFEPTLVEIDTLSLRDPAWVAPAVVIAVRPSPNAFSRVPIGLVRGREVSGTVDVDGAEAGGVAVEFVPIGGGRTLVAAAFTDGSFYAPAVLPGEYDVSVRAEDRERLRAAGAPLRLVVAPGETGALLIRLSLTRR